MSDREEYMSPRRGGISPVLIVAVLIAVVLVAMGISTLVKRYTPTEERADLSAVFEVKEGEVAIYLDQVRLVQKGVRRGSGVYVEKAVADAYLNDRFYYNSEGDLRYMMPEEIVSIRPGDTTFSVGGRVTELGHEAFFAEGETLYVSLKLLEAFSDWNVEVFTEPGRAFITSVFEGRKGASVKKDTVVRQRGGIKSPILVDVASGETVEVLEVLDKWVKVYSGGVVGYVEKADLKELTELTEKAPARVPVFSSLTRKEDICLVWHQVFSASGNRELEKKLGNTKGVNVVAPTWFSLSDNEGNFTSLASKDYVEKAHSLGVEVWGLIDDFSKKINLYTILSDSETRANLIANLMAAVEEVGMDGINIDFENVSEECGVHFVQFYRELSVECRKAGVVLSVDNFAPVGGRDWVNRAEQGLVLDYVIVMGYDEHYAGGPRAGSTASLNFSRNGILDTIEDGVPAKKLINGVPFFTRVWVETPEELAKPDATIIQDATSYFGRYALSSEAVGMVTAINQLKDHGVKLLWLEEEQQFYGEYEEDGCLIRIWVEDLTSLKAKMEVIEEQKIAGAAFWKLGLEDYGVWNVIDSYLN